MLYEPGFSLSHTLYTYVENDWNDYLEYWGLHTGGLAPDKTETDSEFYEKLDAFAHDLRKCVHSLAVDREVLESVSDLVALLGVEDKIPDSSLPKAIDVFKNHPLVEDCIKIQLGYKMAEERADTAEKRMPELLSLLTQWNLSQRSLAYLDRATRLYLWGFDPECVVMCHSVLEAALEERLPDEVVWSHGIKKEGRSYTASQRINAAAAEGLLDDHQRQLCHELREARNATVHRAPQLSLSAQSAIENLATVLRALFPGDE